MHVELNAIVLAHSTQLCILLVIAVTDGTIDANSTAYHTHWDLHCATLCTAWHRTVLSSWGTVVCHDVLYMQLVHLESKDLGDSPP